MGTDASLDPCLLPFVSITTWSGCMLFSEAWVRHNCHRPRLRQDRQLDAKPVCQEGPSSRTVQVSPWIDRTLLLGLSVAASAAPVPSAIPVTLPGAGCQEQAPGRLCTRGGHLEMDLFKEN